MSVSSITTNTNMDPYIQTLKTARASLRRVRPHVTGRFNARLFSESPGLDPYKRLRSDLGEIRLLQLSRGNKEGQVSLRLLRGNTNADTEYYALAPVWDDAEDLEDVNIGDRLVRIPKSLHTALDEFSAALSDNDDRDTMLLWVDVLCIDKSDIKERNEQASAMTQIYKNAQKVIGYLDHGSAPSFDPVVFTLIQRAAKAMREEKALRQGNQGWNFRREWLNDVPELTENHYGGPIMEDPWARDVKLAEIWKTLATSNQYWDEIGRIAQHPIWIRALAVQAILVAPSFHIMAAGSVWLDLQDLELLVSWLWEGRDRAAFVGHGRIPGVCFRRGRPERNKSIPDSMSEASGVRVVELFALTFNLHSLESLRELVEIPGIDCFRFPPRVSHLLINEFTREASDPRDALYGFSILCGLNLQFDYGKTIAKVYTEGAEELLTRIHPEHIMVQAALGDRDNRRDPDLPSWVPDWRLPLQPIYLHDIHETGAGYRGDIKWYEVPYERSKKNWSTRDGVLTVSASRAGVIKYVIPTSPLRQLREWCMKLVAKPSKGEQAAGSSDKNHRPNLSDVFRHLVQTTRKGPYEKQSTAMVEENRLGLAVAFAYFLALGERWWESQWQEEDDLDLDWPRGKQKDPVPREPTALELKLRDGLATWGIRSDSQFVRDIWTKVQGCPMHMYPLRQHWNISAASWPLWEFYTVKLSMYEWIGEENPDPFAEYCLFQLEDGYMGMGPRFAQPGDEVWVLEDAFSPVLLRPTDGNPREFVGRCRVNHIMDGQIPKKVDDGEAALEDVAIA